MLPRPLTRLLAAAVLLSAAATSAWSAPYRITYERTFTATELENFKSSYGLDASIFGVTEGPALLRVSFTLDPALAPVVHFPLGSAIPGGYVAATDFYGYDLAAISDLAAAFGTQSWSLADLSTDTLLGVPVWMDAPLVDGGSPHLTMILDSSPIGMLGIGGPFLNGDQLSLDQSGSVFLIEFQPSNPVILFGEGGTTRVQALQPQPVPAPGTLALLTLGLLPLLGRRRRPALSLARSAASTSLQHAQVHHLEGSEAQQAVRERPLHAGSGAPLRAAASRRVVPAQCRLGQRAHRCGVGLDGPP